MSNSRSYGLWIVPVAWRALVCIPLFTLLWAVLVLLALGWGLDNARRARHLLIGALTKL